MSWSVTINNLKDFKHFPQKVIEDMMTQHIQYPKDMYIALELAKKSNLSSCVLTGMRTPNPYGGDEVVDISVRGHVEALDFQQEMKRILLYGGTGQPTADDVALNRAPEPAALNYEDDEEWYEDEAGAE